MELAKVTSKGQITIPIAIRNALGIREGDKILFMEEGDRVILTNASTNALPETGELPCHRITEHPKSISAIPHPADPL